METPPWYVLTGGPCAGKTTTIHALEERGYPILAEPARLIINEKLAEGHTLEAIIADPDWLSSVVRRAHEQEREVPRDTLYFFDRAAPDSLAYYRHFGKEIDEDLQSALRDIRYRKVFLLDLIDFRNDAARHEDPEEAGVLHGLIREAYESLDYEVIEVPLMPVAERVDFILERL